MQDDLLKNYQQQLRDLRSNFASFSRKHPEIAAFLKLSDTSCNDPFIERLIQATALLTAQLHCQFDDDYSRISESILQQILPVATRDIPSMSILQANPALHIDHAVTIPEGQIIVTQNNSHDCRFTTIYPIHLYPFFIEKITQIQNENIGIVHLQLKTSTTQFFNQQDLGTVRFYINTELSEALALYYLLFNKCLSITPKATIKPVGLARKESMLPDEPTNLSCWNLLIDYFTFPKKFLFFDLILNDSIIESDTIVFELKFDLSNNNYFPQLSNTSLLLSCTPIINLFPAQTKPFHWKSEHYEQLLTPDVAAEVAIYKINSLHASSDNKIVEIDPYFSGQRDSPLNWHLHNHPQNPFDKNNCYSEYRLSIQGDLGSDKNIIIHSEVLCFNQNLEKTHEPSMTFWNSTQDKITAMRSILPITPIIKAGFSDSHWQLVRFILATKIKIDKEYLINTLNLFNITKNQHYKNLIHDLIKVTAEPCVKPAIIDQHNVFIQGERIYILFSGKEAVYDYFFLSVIINEFLQRQKPLNSYYELVIQSEKHGDIARWQTPLS